MRTYGQYCPIARGAEIFAERWTPLIVRNLYLGCGSFGAILAGAPGLSGTLLSQRLASEVALASVLEKALLLQRTLLTGKKEPNVAANELAVEAVNHESDTLDREIRNLKTELELRRELANNSPMAIIQRHGARAAGSRGIYEGDPVPDRLDQLQKGNPGSRP